MQLQLLRRKATLGTWECGFLSVVWKILFFLHCHWIWILSEVGQIWWDGWAARTMSMAIPLFNYHPWLNEIFQIYTFFVLSVWIFTKVRFRSPCKVTCNARSKINCFPAFLMVFIWVPGSVFQCTTNQGMEPRAGLRYYDIITCHPNSGTVETETALYLLKIKKIIN